MFRRYVFTECAQPFVPALAKSGNNPRVECADVCDLVGPEPKFALVGPEHAMQVEAMQPEDPFVVGKRTKLKSESITMKRSASNESGAAAKKLRCGDGLEGQRRISYGPCYDPRFEPDAWHEVFRGGQWVRLEKVERNMKGQEGSGRYRKAQDSSGRA